MSPEHLSETPPGPPPTRTNAPSLPGSPSGAKPSGRELWRALAIVFGATLLLLALQLLYPPLSGYTQLGLAIVLFQAPWWVLPRTTPVAETGCTFTIGPVLPGLRLGFSTMAIVFPLFVGGFHLVYTGLLDRPADWDASHVLRWDEDLEYAPPDHCRRPEALVWVQRDALWIIAPPDSALRVSAPIGPSLASARLVRCTGAGAVVRPEPPPPPSPDGLLIAPGTGLRLPLARADDFRLDLTDAAGRPFPAARIRTGANLSTPSDDGRVEGSLSALWLLTFIVIQLGLVALPEEHFFRGYLQSRLDRRWGTPFRLLGTPVGWGLLAASAAFALLHPILIPGPHRLLVFFPALLFGWLRARQGHLGAAVLVHAGSNLLLAIVGRMYG